jgi:hypothetical protein
VGAMRARMAGLRCQPSFCNTSVTLAAFSGRVRTLMPLMLKILRTWTDIAHMDRERRYGDRRHRHSRCAECLFDGRSLMQRLVSPQKGKTCSARPNRGRQSKHEGNA